MASLHSAWIKLETLKTIVGVLEKRGDKGLALQIAVNDEANDYEQNVVITVSQSKEEREAKKPKFYVGNGKTFWTDGKISVPQKVEEAEVVDESAYTTLGDDDMPF